MKNTVSLWNDRFFDDRHWPFRLFDGEETPKARGFTPAVDVEETEDAFSLKFDLPGMEKKDINIDLADGHLVVSGKRETFQEERKGTVTRTERFQGSFSRSFTLPENVQLDDIDATYENGVLNLRLPKTEKLKPVQIAIR